MSEVVQAQELDPSTGKVFAYVYDNGCPHPPPPPPSYSFRSSHNKLLEAASSLFIHENALNPMAFPSLKPIESQVTPPPPPLSI
jgi:hypothetical protein